jgi:quercetin dioxygenase-like cupin family protein
LLEVQICRWVTFRGWKADPLVVLSRILNVNLAELLSDQPESISPVIRQGSRASHVRPEGRYVHLSNTLVGTNIDVVQISLTAHDRLVDMKEHPGEEWLYVLRGDVKLELNSDEYVLHTGDSAHFLATTPHRMTAASESAEVLLNITAPSRAH